MMVLIDPLSNRTIDPNSKRFSLLQKRASTRPVDPYYSYVTALLHFDGTNGSTSTPSNAPVGSATWAPSTGTITTSQSVFGGASIDLTAGNAFVPASSNAPLTFGAVDWTVEGWWRFSTTAGDQVLSEQSSGGPTFEFYKSSAGTLRIVQNATDALLGTWTGVTTGVWYHVAIVRFGSTVYGYINGTQVGSTAAQTINDGGGATRVGGHAGAYFSGYVDEYRVTKGIARYTTNFTVPGSPFPNH